MLSLRGVHASKREWEEGRECVVLFFILSPFKEEGGKMRRAAKTLSIIHANYPQLSKPLKLAMSPLLQWQTLSAFLCGKAGHLI